jgi:hypothetical protein
MNGIVFYFAMASDYSVDSDAVLSSDKTSA